jgi:hypothetical protein
MTPFSRKMPNLESTVTSELIDLNHLIDDVGSLLPSSMVEHTVLAYDLAADLPYIEGDYRSIRRLFLNLLSEVNGMISLKTWFTQADRAYLSENFPGVNLPEGKYILLEVTEVDSDTEWHANLDSARIRQYLFPCIVRQTTRPEQAEMAESRFVRRFMPARTKMAYNAGLQGV